MTRTHDIWAFQVVEAAGIYRYQTRLRCGRAARAARAFFPSFSFFFFLFPSFFAKTPKKCRARHSFDAFLDIIQRLDIPGYRVKEPGYSRSTVIGAASWVGLITTERRSEVRPANMNPTVRMPRTARIFCAHAWWQVGDGRVQDGSLCKLQAGRLAQVQPADLLHHVCCALQLQGRG